MSRDDGFPIADIDVGILRDVKIRRLRQHVPADDVSATTLLYLAVLLSSWEEGYRLTIEEADSPVPATPERIAALRAVGLVDADDKIPLGAWEAWFKPAWDRRDRKRAGGLEGNRRRWHPDKEPPRSPIPVPSDTDSHTDSASDSDPESPSVPSVNQSGLTVPSPRATNGHVDQTNGRDVTTCPACGDGPLDEKGANIVTDRRGQLWHRECPTRAIVDSMVADLAEGMVP